MSSRNNTIYEILKAPQTVFTPTLIAQLVQEIDNLSLIPIQDLSKNFSKFDELIDNAQGDKINKLMVHCVLRYGTLYLKREYLQGCIMHIQRTAVILRMPLMRCMNGISRLAIIMSYLVCNLSNGSASISNAAEISRAS